MRFLQDIDKRMMSLALAEARKGLGRTSPNPMVGAVIVKDGRIIAKGWHAKAGGPHAEVVALTKAGEAARGADLYVTLEPCHHYGRTPPCTQAVLAAGIKRVIIAQMDPNPHVVGGGAEFLAAKGLEVVTGVLAEPATALNEVFNKYITTGRPFVTLKSAATLDGKLATHTGHSRWVTDRQARTWVHSLRARSDAIMVGRGTVAQDDPTLNVRLAEGKKWLDPCRVILDTHLSLPLSARVFDPSSGGPTIVACGPNPPPAKVGALTDQGVKVWPLPLHNGRISLLALMDRLGAEKICSLLIEGGAEVNYAALLEDRIVDKILFFFAPKIIGGREAPSLVDGPGLATMEQALVVDIRHIRRLGPDLLIEAVPIYGA